jgi:hypothetical protein
MIEGTLPLGRLAGIMNHCGRGDCVSTRPLDEIARWLRRSLTPRRLGTPGIGVERSPGLGEFQPFPKKRLRPVVTPTRCVNAGYGTGPVIAGISIPADGDL